MTTQRATPWCWGTARRGGWAWHGVEAGRDVLATREQGRRSTEVVRGAAGGAWHDGRRWWGCVVARSAWWTPQLEKELADAVEVELGAGNRG